MLDELLNAALALGIEVRRERLAMKDMSATSGLVTMKGKELLLLDSSITDAEMVEQLAAALRGKDLENVFLSPAARDLIESGR